MISHPDLEYLSAMAESIAIIFLAIILISAFFRKKDPPTRKPFYFFTSTLILLLAENACSRILDAAVFTGGTSRALDIARSVLFIVDFILYATLDDFFFWYIIASIRERRAVSEQFTRISNAAFRAMLAVSFTSGILFATSPWTGWFFTIGAGGTILLTSGYWFLVGFAMISAAIGIGVVIWNRKTLGTGKMIACLLYQIVPVSLVYVDMYYHLAISYICCAIDMAAVYITVDIQQDHKLLEQETALARQEAEMSGMRVDLMMSQIQPHFLYNSLSSIASLCRKDPKEAEIAVNEFSEYLGMNLRSIVTKKPIRFETELNHVGNYLNIQKRRFPDQLRVEYDIRATEFRLPALTLQPIVENAVKHGVETRFEPTTIRLSSFETDGDYVITVEDDGPGFDPAAPQKDDRPHIGIASVQSRLENMSGGTLEISGMSEKGTRVTVRIPKKSEGLPQ